ncbi:MAG: HAD family phosphatase [Clostridium sp.]|nr:HAD family phosphatase [Clostridium sp.]
MTKIKLICIDVDGTLYNDEKEIPKENIQAIQEATKKGILIAITTGRMYNYGNLYGKMLGVPTITIASNGAFVKYEDEVINHQFMENGDVYEVQKIIDDQGLFAHYNTWNALICKGELGNGNGYVAANKQLGESQKIEIVAVEDVASLHQEFRNREGQYLKVIVLSEGNLEALQSIRNQFKNHPRLQAVSSSTVNIELFPKAVNKAVGIQALIERLGITKEEVMAIGDEENDLPMIKFAGIGVAMGNATAEVKTASNHITATNNEAGVAKAIQKFCL